MIVAIDGPAGVGKSSIARKIAEKTKFLYINSGSFYRAITLIYFEQQLSIEEPHSIIAAARNLHFSLKNGRLLLDGRDVEDALYNDQVDSLVAKVSAIPELREIVNASLRKAARGLDAVVEGRDITTVVFPDAEVKIYLDASVETRARRRFEQGVSNLALNEIIKSIKNRDEIDKNKQEGKLKIAADAFYLDTSDLTIDEVCEKVLWKIRQKEKQK